jgi:hypothetical protein
LAPPILSGRWLKKMRAPMKATPKIVKMSDVPPHP